MKKIWKLLILSIFIFVSCGTTIGLQVFAEGSEDFYYFDDEHLYFDLNGMKYAYSSGGDADIRFRTSGSSWNFMPFNGAAIKDLEQGDFDDTAAPSSGYSADMVAVAVNHIYAVRCGDGSYGILMVTGYDSDAGNAEFLAKPAEPERKLDLYYLSGDYIRFDLETMKNVSATRDSDIHYNYYRTTINGENGATIKDLSAVGYESAKAPLYGYTTDDVKLVKDHVYAVRSNSKGIYIIKVTNIVSESNFEFLAREAEMESQNTKKDDGDDRTGTLPEKDNSNGSSNAEDSDISSDNGDLEISIGDEDHVIKTNRAKTTELYWVENGTKFVLSGKVIFEDTNEILDPFLSPDRKYIVYSNGSTDLFIYDIAKKTKKKIYTLKSTDYGVYAAGWSQDGKQVAFMTSYKGGFIGGNQLYVLTLSTKKTSVVAKGLSSADWSKNGKFAIANGKSVWLVDKSGRNKVTLKVPAANAFFGADNVSFTSDGNKVIYNVAGKYYLHDIKKNQYKELAIQEDSTDNGTVRAGKTGKIAVIQDKSIYIYDPADENYGLLYGDAEVSFPNWVSR